MLVVMPKLLMLVLKSPKSIKKLQNVSISDSLLISPQEVLWAVKVEFKDSLSISIPFSKHDLMAFLARYDPADATMIQCLIAWSLLLNCKNSRCPILFLASPLMPCHSRGLQVKLGLLPIFPVEVMHTQQVIMRLTKTKLCCPHPQFTLQLPLSHNLLELRGVTLTFYSLVLTDSAIRTPWTTGSFISSCREFDINAAACSTPISSSSCRISTAS